MIRWPWIVLGVLTALYVVATKRTLEWKVTPKGADALNRPLDLRVLLPPLLLVALFALPVMLVPDPGAAGGYFLLSIVGACAYAATAGALVVLHRHENPRTRSLAVGDRRLLSSGPVALATIGLGAGAPGPLERPERDAGPRVAGVRGVGRGAAPPRGLRRRHVARRAAALPRLDARRRGRARGGDRAPARRRDVVRRLGPAAAADGPAARRRRLGRRTADHL